jgi:hypothetical protein
MIPERTTPETEIVDKGLNSESYVIAVSQGMQKTEDYRNLEYFWRVAPISIN